ncbi:Formamidopyrimidine-DNA glycosylase [Aureliella helgolandensis]|uniref:Formamidopyrimidine-DNA glycosylase n=2 Tax=Aureliella helgolandensis TaxID=2527968 RepID=A0A518GF23_9BACT|nr:Formamidopyrimidine-DNA glycosylase [Aureliella helgolandensis]
MCRGLRPLLGRRIADVTLPACRYRPIVIQPAIGTIQQQLVGGAIDQISRLGKRVVLHISPHVLVLQPKMTGLVSLELPPSHEHVRLQIDFKGQPRLRMLFWDRRGLGTVEMLLEEELHQRIVQGRLGPDALAITLAEFRQRLSSTSRAIKVALLDQKLLAGVGNLYASEMLHQARIHPARVCSSLSSKKTAALHAAMLEILLTAIEHEGSTLSDGTYRNALNDPGSYQNMHRVYDRAGELCPQCQRSKIVRIVQAQRSTFYCPTCQR